MLNKNKTYDFLLFCGDIHSKIDVIPNFLKKNGLRKCAVFQVGDFGIGFDNEHKENKRMIYLNKRMSVYNSDLFVIRGNHDNPKYFDGNFNMSNLFLLKDYSVVNINGINILGIGGGISIDRTDRSGYWNPKKTHNYWKDETILFDEDKLKELRNINIVITHSAPNFCFPLFKPDIKEWVSKDKILFDDIVFERNLLRDIHDILYKNNNITNWYYGHFHKNYTLERNGIKFNGLEINGFDEYVLKYEF